MRISPLLLALVAIAAVATVAPAQAETDLPVFTAANISADGSIAYVSTLAACTFTLVSSYCGVDGISCDGYDDSGNADINQQCAIGAAAAAATADALADAVANPCAIDDGAVYNQGLHVAGIFIILAASLIGAGLPVLGKYVPLFAVHPFALVLGKCLGIGILLACALVHLLQPASEELTDACLSYEFTDDYNAYAFLFAMLAILFMQFLDFMVESWLVDRLEEIDDRKQAAAGSSSHLVKPKVPDNVVVVTGPCAVPDEECAPVVKFHLDEPAPIGMKQLDSPSAAQPAKDHSIAEPVKQSYGTHDDDHAHGEHGHVHSILMVKGVKRTIAAYLLEFGVTSHSIFIGLTTGVASQSELKSLLVALVFHQMFEGVALGSRIADADFGNHWEELVMVLIFALSAPLGMGIGVGVATTLNPNGSTYNYVAGSFDAICAGILIYIGLMLLIRDFVEDMKAHCKKDARMKFAMFVALWTGAGVMAYIGKYL